MLHQLSMQTPRDSPNFMSLNTQFSSKCSTIHLSNRPHSSAISQNTKSNRTPWSAPRQTWRSCAGKARGSTPPSTSSERTRWDSRANSTNLPIGKRCIQFCSTDNHSANERKFTFCSLLQHTAELVRVQSGWNLFQVPLRLKVFFIVFFMQSVTRLKAEECYDWGVYTKICSYTWLLKHMQPYKHYCCHDKYVTIECKYSYWSTLTVLLQFHYRFKDFVCYFQLLCYVLACRICWY